MAKTAMPGFEIGYAVDGVGMIGLWGVERKGVEASLGEKSTHSDKGTSGFGCEPARGIVEMRNNLGIPSYCPD